MQLRDLGGHGITKNVIFLNGLANLLGIEFLKF